MYRATLQTASRRAAGGLRSQTLQCASRRFASTASPADRSRSWKSSALRWGLAIGAVYYYNTSSVFAEEAAAPQLNAAPSSFAESDLPTVETVIEQKRKQLQPKVDEQKKPAESQSNDPKAAEKQPSTESQTTAVGGSPEALEEEAGQQGAFNPETGEINWDCPCLGGMADGPCGEQFKTAFSCFVYSTEEPKGMDCIEKFQGMQECFREYPDIYGAELSDDEAGEDPNAEIPQVPSDEPVAPATKDNALDTSKSTDIKPEAEESVPKEWKDATDVTDKDLKEEQPAQKAEKEKE
ncbi:Oxidoreductase [Conoideocrella luteorostrata]|uniref:Mitochondrial intermembrane space import and assembly protein 40 n=1 Tax=Conoideocrella luteorostrata TaxID=1105319 RepID=A0AAJ0G0H3_9HYPO|nr:Oxidoreductase [Conoideocrella luteorostrata]